MVGQAELEMACQIAQYEIMLGNDVISPLTTMLEVISLYCELSNYSLIKENRAGGSIPHMPATSPLGTHTEGQCLCQHAFGTVSDLEFLEL